MTTTESSRSESPTPSACGLESAHEPELRSAQGGVTASAMRRLFASVFAASALLAAPLAACSDDVRQCRVGADCASGLCAADGTCVSGSGTDAGAADRVVPVEAGEDAQKETSTSGDAGCGAAPFDGIITRAEVPLAAGLRATYKVATSTDVDTRGVAQADGSREWDFSGAYAGDHATIVETLKLDGTWYATKFPTGTYATKLAEGSDLLGVFELGQGSLSLLGVVSPTDGISRTELTYGTKVATLVFPVTKGQNFKTMSSSVSGLASGITSFYTESYDSTVDAQGKLKTPLGTFSVLRIATTLTRTVGFLVTTIRSFSFVAECYGVVASVTSQDNESDVEFTRAKELRRISP